VTKETAFVHALTNAALVHIIARACSHGELPSLCGCDNRLQGQEISEGKQWGGCSDNVEFGKTFAKKFLDAIEIENLQNDTDHALVKLHNNKVGRLVSIFISCTIIKLTDRHANTAITLHHTNGLL
jgi:hypothetical protein